LNEDLLNRDKAPELRAQQARLPVVLVHGIWNTAGIFSVLQAYLEQQGWPVYGLSMTPNNGDASLESLAEQVASFIDRSLGAHQSFDLIGFSMGGLISRYYVQRLGGLTRVRRFITLSTPHQGTLLAALSHRYGIRQMRPNSPFLKSLNQDIYQLKQLQFFSLWTPFDLLILPPWSSNLSHWGIGESHRLLIATHDQMIQDPAGLSAIATCLCQDSAH